MNRWNVIALLLLLTTVQVYANDVKNVFKKSIALSFHPLEDGLCFSNHGFKEHAGKNPFTILLSSIADKEGACQGMVGTAAALKTRAIFRPDMKKMDGKTINKTVRRAVNLHNKRCEGKVFIDGYADIRSLCHEHESILKKRSVLYNLELAHDEILDYSWTFFNTHALMDEQKISKHLYKHLKKMYQNLENGEYPLMLVRSHVTLVIGMDIKHDEKGNPREITLRHYDPNIILSSESDFNQRRYLISEDGNSISGKLIWDITPKPLTKIACSFIKIDVKN